MKRIEIKAGAGKYRVNPGDKAFDSVAAEIFKHREYRSGDAYIARARHAVIDAGAHVGLFTLYCRALNKNVKIITLEPEPANYKILKDNLKVNGVSGVDTFQCALWSKTGKGKLRISGDSINHRLAGEGDEISGEKVLTVNTISLGDLLSECGKDFADFIKMDIEGAEYEIVKSWRAADFAKIGAVMMEYHDDKINKHGSLEKIFRENGFSVSVYPSKFQSNLGFMLALNKKLRRNNYGK